MAHGLDAVVFDLGNVVIAWDPRNLYRSVFEDEERMEGFLAEVAIYDYNEALDQGRDPESVVTEWVRRHPGWEPELRLYWERWSETLGPVDHDVVEVAHQTSRLGLGVHALSNWGEVTFERYAPHDVLGVFDRILISGRVGLTKPDPAIFRLAVSEFGSPPDRLLFVDDSSANIQAAAAHGWRTHLFRDAGTLRAHLLDTGIELPARSGPR